uniref:Uncharacterized protein n=1 Tax=Aegilops tauschii subsp. strangulata TaxID=200361 RepID=A0A453BTA2_AEGTS
MSCPVAAPSHPLAACALLLTAFHLKRLRRRSPKERGHQIHRTPPSLDVTAPCCKPPPTLVSLLLDLPFPYVMRHRRSILPCSRIWARAWDGAPRGPASHGRRRRLTRHGLRLHPVSGLLPLPNSSSQQRRAGRVRPRS